MTIFHLSNRCACASLLSILFLVGCVLHPPYSQPHVEVPENWRISADESSAYANYRWWEQFQDPVLDCLISEALDGNKDLKIAIARVYAFAGELQVVRSAMYPQINGSAQALRQKVSIALTPLPQGFARTSNQYAALFNASYEVDIWGKIRSASEAALADLFASVDARRTVVLTLVTSVANAYVQMRQFDEQLTISRKTFQSRKESYELAQKRFLGGLTSELEPKQQEADMESAAAQVILYEVLVAQQENLLSVLIGHAPQAINRGLPIDALVLPWEVPAGLPSDLLEQRPDILQAEELLVSANAKIGVAKANFFPSISLTGNYGNESLALHDLLTSPARTWQYAAMLLQPIFTGGLLTGELEVAEARKWEAYYAYEQTVLKAFQEVDDSLIEHQKSKELVAVQKKRTAALLDALHLATLQYDNGQVDYLNVLDAERNLFAAELDLASAQGDTFLSLISLYKALGGGWVIDADAEALPPPIKTLPPWVPFT